jgi:hypothetical protein
MGSLSTRGRLERFSIRDCTLHTKGNYMLSLSYQPASLIFERVRFIGFDSGGGGSVLLANASHGLALHATDCRFEGGYGPAPEWGTLLDVRNDALIARFDRCGFDELHLDVWRWTAGTTAGFSNCTLSNLLDTKTVIEQAATKPGVEFDGCSFGYFGGDPEHVPAKDLEQLFPDWRRRMQ